MPFQDNTLTTNPQDATAFVGTAFRRDPDAALPGHLLIWTLNPVNQRKQSRWFRSIEEVCTYAVKSEAALAKLNVYIGMGLSGPDARTGPDGNLTPYRRLLSAPANDPKTGRPLATVGFVPGLWADVDYGEAGHKTQGSGKSYPPDSAFILDKLDSCPLPPTIVVHSGHGLQLYWIFEDFLDVSGDLEGATARQARWQDLLREWMAPYDLDSVHNLDRVMRLPGFINRKDPAIPVPASTIFADGPLTTLEAVEALLPTVTTPPPGKRPKSRSGAAAGGVPHDPEANPNELLFNASYETSTEFSGAWDGNRPDISDQSASGYDMALANVAASLGWKEDQIVNLIIARRRHAGARSKHAKYFSDTADKAVNGRSRPTGGKRRAAPGTAPGAAPGATAGPKTAPGKKARKSSPGRKPTPAQEKRDTEDAGALEYINDVRSEGNTIFWLGDFYQYREGVWSWQDKAYFAHQIRRVLAAALEVEDVVPSDTMMNAYLNALADAITPACIDTALLSEKDRLLNFHLDSGALIDGTCFRNSVVMVDGSGMVHRRALERREYFTTGRPYPYPADNPPPPVLFDAWLTERMPEPETRQALYEAMGATVLQLLPSEERLVALLGGGGTGKGTIIRTVGMLMGREQTMSVTSPARLVSSAFALSQLPKSSLLTIPDMPAMPSREGIARDNYLQGLGVVKSMSGGDAIPVEGKFKDQTTARVNASIWIDTNFSIQAIVGGEDYKSWERRVLAFPMHRNLPQEKQEPYYEHRFRQEVSQIAWYAVHAYAVAKARGSFTRSAEMSVLMTSMRTGTVADVEGYIDTLLKGADLWMSRAALRAGFISFLQTPDVTREVLTALYSTLARTVGIQEVGRQGARGFRGVGDPGPTVDPEE